MEGSYGVGIKNKFALDTDEYSDPSEIGFVTKSVKEVNLEEKENKTAPAKAKAPKKKTVKIEAKPSASQGKAAPRAERPKLSDQEERNNRRNKPDNRSDVNKRPEGDRPPRRSNDRPPRRDDQMANGENAPRRFNPAPPRRFEDRRFEGDSEGGMRARGRGMGRGGRGGRGGRREFDRHSGSDRSGVRPTDKREGSGSYNWGSNKDHVEDEKEAIDEKDKADTTDEGLGQSGEESAPETKEAEEPQEMTLSEYKALQKAKRSKPEVNLRKAGEGENADQWKSTYVLKKKDDVKEKEKKIREKSSDSSSEDEKEVVSHKTRTKTILHDIDFQFTDSPMRGRGRGRGRGGMGRGMGRGGRGRGNFNRVREQQAPKMDDECDFPSLK